MSRKTKELTKLAKIKTRLGATYKINRLIKSILKNTRGLDGTKLRFSKGMRQTLDETGKNLLEVIVNNLETICEDNQQNNNANNSFINPLIGNEIILQALKDTRYLFPSLPFDIVQE